MLISLGYAEVIMKREPPTSVNKPKMLVAMIVAVVGMGMALFGIWKLP